MNLAEYRFPNMDELISRRLSVGIRGRRYSLVRPDVRFQRYKFKSDDDKRRFKSAEDFYRILRTKYGRDVEEVDQQWLDGFARRRGYRGDAPIGYRLGDKIFVSRNNSDSLLTEAEKASVAAHEEGHSHGRSESTAWSRGMEILHREIGDEEVLKRAAEMYRNHIQ